MQFIWIFVLFSAVLGALADDYYYVGDQLNEQKAGEVVDVVADYDLQYGVRTVPASVISRNYYIRRSISNPESCFYMRQLTPCNYGYSVDESCHFCCDSCPGQYATCSRITCTEYYLH
ncbi:hypothetical protein ACFFRR_006721 [Megaselia abdita]